MGKLGHYMLVAGAALCAVAAFADCEISLDPAAKPFRDLRKIGCDHGIGFRVAPEIFWSAADDDWWFVTNRLETARALKQAGAHLLRLEDVNRWFRRRNAADPKMRPSNPKAAFDLFRANDIKVLVCLECASTNAVDESLEIVQWLVDNGYKDVVAGFESDDESLDGQRSEALAQCWADFLARAEKIWPKLPRGCAAGHKPPVEYRLCQRVFRNSLTRARLTLAELSQPEESWFCPHRLAALSDAVYINDRTAYDQPRMEVGHRGTMYRILGEALRSNPLLYQHGTLKEDGAEIEYLFSGDGRGRYCLLMVNSTPAAARVRVVIPGRQFAAPTYRALSCPEKFVDCREVPGEGRYWHRLSWEDTQTGYETWSNWEPQGNTYVPLPCDVKPKCDDMLVTVEPHTVQSVEFMTRAVPRR